MNKSKFKSVKFKPFDAEMYYSSQEMWVNSFGLCGDSSCVLKVTDSCIEVHPELFEVEKAEREFEDGAWYKARIKHYCDWEAVRFYEGYGFKRIGLIACEPATAFYEIGERIEL